MKVLIITHTQDNQSISMVSEAIKEQGGEAIRFNTDQFPTEVNLELYYHQGEQRLILTNNSQQFDLQEVTGVWYRRLNIGGKIPKDMDWQLRQASRQESRATVLGMIASLQAFHLDSLINVERAKHKQLQLQIAQQLGLEIPRNLTTNNPEAVRAFAQECESGMVTKMLSSFAIYEEGKEKVVFTNPVTPQQLEDLGGLNLCPMTFQELVPKALELRTTIVGKQIFTAAIDSQSREAARHDWRRQGIALIKEWKPYQLPQKLEEKLLQLMANLGLNYGALDLILTPDGRYVFLEVNPVGEFFWLEMQPGLPISRAIANLLLAGGE